MLDDGTYDYEYDDNGNRTKKTHSTSGDYVEYSWDHRNRLTLVTFRDDQDAKTKEVCYTYDVFDRLIRKEVDDNGNGTFDSDEAYAYDGDDVILVFDNSGNWTHRYLHGNAVDQVFAEETVGEILWGLTDNQGTVRDIANYDPTLDETEVLNHRKFDAYGNITAESDSNYAYTGRFHDADSELQYNRARWYDAQVGRWISEDPIGFAAGDFNVNRYVSNAPTNGIDPSGLFREARKWDPNGSPMDGTFEEFGAMTGVSRRHIREGVVDGSPMDDTVMEWVAINVYGYRSADTWAPNGSPMDETQEEWIALMNRGNPTSGRRDWYDTVFEIGMGLSSGAMDGLMFGLFSPIQDWAAGDKIARDAIAYGIGVAGTTLPNVISGIRALPQVANSVRGLGQNLAQGTRNFIRDGRGAIPAPALAGRGTYGLSTSASSTANVVISAQAQAQLVHGVYGTANLLVNADTLTHAFMTEHEAVANGLRVRDDQWPWRGLHEFEQHHPLPQGTSFREFFRQRRLSDADIQRTIRLRTDIHRAIEESGYWQTQLFGRIQAEEALNGGRQLSRSRILEIVDELLDDLATWSQ